MWRSIFLSYWFVILGLVAYLCKVARARAQHIKILQKRVCIILYSGNRQFQDNRQWYKHLLYGGLFVRVYLGVWRCLSIADRQPTSSLLTPLSGCKGEKTLKNHACTTVWHNAVFILQYKPIRHIHYGTPLQLQDVTRQPFRS